MPMLRLVLLVAIGCSSPPPRVPVRRAVEVLPDVAFAELDHAQRTKLMKEHVLPAMTKRFRDHDPKKFADVTCKTCHAKHSFEMPNPELPHLDFDDLSGFEERDVEWMKSEIVPTMRELLKDPTLRCGRCHPIVESPAKS
jgi:hypothetical protein